jgi:hypothetical protein
MELELNGWKVKAALIALLVVVVCAPFARASMSNKGRADDWRRRAVVAEEAVGGLRLVIAERSRALNQRTLQANQLANRLDSRGMVLAKTKGNVGTLTRRQSELTAENTRARTESKKLRTRLATTEALARKLNACSQDLTAALAWSKGKKPAAIAAAVQPLVKSCRDAGSSFDAYLKKAP